MSLHARERAARRFSPPVERQPGPTPLPRRRIRPRPRPPERRILVAGLVASAAIHLLMLVFFQGFFSGEPELDPRAAPEPERPAESWMRAYNVRASADDVPSIEEQVAARVAPPAERPVERPDEPEPAEPAAEVEVRERRPAVERLRTPEPGDPRLWQRPGPRVTPPTDEELMRARVYGRIESWADSVMAAAEAERRALDWTYTAPDGKRWGISPEGIHLGDITLPAPSFAPPPGRRAEIEARIGEWHDIQRQAEMTGTRDSFRERVRAIRERRDRERAESDDPPP